MTISQALAAYLKSREGDFLVYSHYDDCDIVDVHKLKQLIDLFIRKEM